MAARNNSRHGPNRPVAPCWRPKRSIAVRASSSISLTLGTLVLTSVAAAAADLPQRPAYQAPAVVAPAPSWTGCYLGGNVGFAWGHGEITSTVGSLNGSGNNNGFAGGGQIGCDYQWGPMVL